MLVITEYVSTYVRELMSPQQTNKSKPPSLQASKPLKPWKAWGAEPLDNSVREFDIRRRYLRDRWYVLIVLY